MLGLSCRPATARARPSPRVSVVGGLGTRQRHQESAGYREPPNKTRSPDLVLFARWGRPRDIQPRERRVFVTVPLRSPAGAADVDAGPARLDLPGHGRVAATSLGLGRSSQGVASALQRVDRVEPAPAAEPRSWRVDESGLGQAPVGSDASLHPPHAAAARPAGTPVVAGSTSSHEPEPTTWPTPWRPASWWPRSSRRPRSLKEPPVLFYPLVALPQTFGSQQLGVAHPADSACFVQCWRVPPREEAAGR